MKGYAYLDKYGIMHASEYQDTAKKYAKYNGKVVETELCDGSGYTDENDYNTMIYAAEKEFFYGKSKAREHKLSEDQFAVKFPQTYALYKELI